MRYLYVLRGFSASGKSQLIEQHKHFSAYTLSSDKYRLICGCPIHNTEGYLTIPQDVSGRAWKRLKEDLEYRMERGEFTIIDATHLRKNDILEYRKLCRKYFYKLCVVNFNVDIDTCIENNKKRMNTYSYVSPEVIKEMAHKKEELPNSIRQINSDEFYTDIYSKYNHINFDNYENIWIIGDIHGCYEPLKNIINRVNMNTDAVVFVGDYFDRGIQNVEVFKAINNIIDNPNVYCCIGNHELRMFDYIWGKDVSRSRFGRETLKQFHDNNITDKDIELFCKKLVPCVRFYYNENYVLVSHAGVSNGNIDITTPEVYFTKGIGTYEDMNKVCDFYEAHNNMEHIQEIQIFGHRNNNDVPIKINDMCYNICGFPEYGGTLKALKMYKYENTIAMEEIYEYNKVFSKEGLYIAMSKYPDRFPIKNVETLIGAMRHNKYIKETPYGHISSFNFTKEAFYDDIWDGIDIRARGLFINTHTNKIVARSYNKFFNLGQHECSTIDKFEAPITLYKKYDGFLGIIGYDEETDKIIYCSKSTITPYGEYANLFESKIKPHIKDEQELKEYLKDYNISLVFECIAPKEDNHIIKYNEDKCVFLEIVHNTIEYKNELYKSSMWNLVFDEFKDIIAKEQICKYETIDVFTNNIDTLKSHVGFEGFVAVDKYNNMFKLKTYEYEKLKFIRTQKDYYFSIKQKAGSHNIKYPDIKKFENRYEQVYDRDTVNEAYAEVCKYIDTLNLTYQEK